jgi:hypothetical protein
MTIRNGVNAISEQFLASVQFGDFKGTIAIDGHESGFQEELRGRTHG